jgi:hypothetical protein
VTSTVSEYLVVPIVKASRSCTADATHENVVFRVPVKVDMVSFMVVVATHQSTPTC